MAAQVLVEQRHRVVLDARNGKRAKDALATIPGAERAVIEGLGTLFAEEFDRRFEIIPGVNSTTAPVLKPRMSVTNFPASPAAQIRFLFAFLRLKPSILPSEGTA